MTQRTYIQEIC